MESAGRIRVLTQELADQIAAGEVVERPASVVKELVENAIDAGARRIEVEIEAGGRDRILVIDDGCGMSAAEMALAVKRYATSKLTSVEDLFRLGTMGFRGEALPSIAAVSQLALSSRLREREGAGALEGGEGQRILVKAGRVVEQRPIGVAAGTQIEVRDLFSVVPARLKFLKAEATETSHVVDVLIRLGLAFPELSFRLRSRGRVLVELPSLSGPNAAKERAIAALSRGRGRVELHEAKGIDRGVHVEAYLASPAECATTTRGTYLFVNRRAVRDRGLLQALHMGFDGLLERGRYPLAVLHVTVPTETVDVNVHPQKLEVRFARPADVYAAVRHVVRESVARAPWLAERAGAQLQPYAREEAPAYATAELLDLFAPQGGTGDLFASSAASARPSVDAAFFSSLVYLGQLDHTYLLCEGAGELVLVDQHAAHERVAFERLMNAVRTKAAPSQRLLVAERVQLDDAARAATLAHADALREVGFELEGFGDDAIAVRAVPAMLAEARDVALVEVVRALAEELVELDAPSLMKAADAPIEHMMATVACHSVVRAGDALTPEEARALFARMDGIDFSAHCPHGRPVLVRVSLAEIERRFGRA